MSDDVLQARASVDWAQSQLSGLQQRLDAWLDQNVSIDIVDLPPPATRNPLIAIEGQPLPLAFNVEVGAYINAVRSSLDILAVALVRRHNLKVEIRDVQFPISCDERAFVKNKFVTALPVGDQNVIKKIKPYGGNGGNAALWALHRVDIERKHRRLLNVEVKPKRLFIAGIADMPNIVSISDFPGWAPGPRQTIIGLMSKDEPVPYMEYFPIVAFNETGFAYRKPVVDIVSRLALVARSVIDQFGH
jgi:hypothetical protein